MRAISKRFLSALVCISFVSTIAVGQETPPAEQTPAGPPRPAAAGAGAQQASGDPQPYDRVITKDAKSKDGIFKVHQVRDRYFFEIPKDMLDKEFLWVSQISRTTLGVGNGGDPLGNRVVRWEKIDNKIHLRSINYRYTAGANEQVSLAVQAANNDTIVMTFNIAAYGPEESSVIDVGRLFTTDVFELSARQRLSATALDATRTYIEKMSAFPENINIVATHTYTRAAAPAGAGGGGAFGQQGMSPGSATVVMHHSMVKLPDNPMMPRYFDPRVGYFSLQQTDFGSNEHKAVNRRLILRWRLEKKDPNAALSEPVKPIIYYIDRATPPQWIEATKRGVEKWQKAFEAAGFKNAIIAKMAPSKEEDPDFDPSDARYSVIRWLASTTENARGPNVHDPRTGEILEADIEMYHNILNLLRNWYFVQVAPLDPRAQKLPFPDELMADLVEYVVAHEVGHTLGFQHNMKSSATYSIENIRDRDWVKKMGHTPSLMDYSRYNYVAQPEDNIDVADLIPGIGPYDVWATRWGYKPIPGAKSPEDELPTLDSWSREQDSTPWFRFSTAGSMGSDPGELTEAVGDADAVRATTLGLKNLERVSKLLMSASTTRPGTPYDDLSELYARMLGQWTLEMNHVSAVVGGFDSQQKHVGQEGVRFTPVPKARQTEAVRFLLQNAFVTPTWMVDKEILRRIEPVGVLNRIRTAQNSVLNNLMSSPRFARLVEQRALDGASSYAPTDFVTEVRKGVWKELDGNRVVIDEFRRNLQRSYLDIVNLKLNPPPASAQAANTPQAALAAAMNITSGDERGVYRAELRALSASLSAALLRTTDRATRAHIEASRDQISKILNPSFAGVSTTTGSRTAFADFQELLKSDFCWHDFSIR
jgi:hypothetical protein